MSPKMNSSVEWPLRSSSESGSSPPPINGGCHRPGGPSESSSVSASQLFTKWLIKKQASSSENDSSGHQRQSMMSPVAATVAGRPSRGQLFPARLALGLGMAKTLLGVLLVAFGALALWEQASMSYLGSGEFFFFPLLSSYYYTDELMSILDALSEPTVVPINRSSK